MKSRLFISNVQIYLILVQDGIEIEFFFSSTLEIISINERFAENQS